MKKTYLLSLILLFSISVFSQNKPIYKHSELYTVVNAVKDKYITDKRVKVFDIEALYHEKKPTIQGVTSDTAAYNMLIDKVTELYGADFVNKVQLLPAKDLGEKTYGVINLSVADIREAADFTSGMATQAILGTPIRILQKDNWYRIQTPDGYIGWTQQANFHPMTKGEFNAWTTSKKIVFTDFFGFSYSQADKDSQTVSDLVAGNMLRLDGEDGDFYKISYPDGKTAYVLKSQSEPYDKWSASLNLTGESIVKKAFTMMGIPYVWGGTSVKGMDCSGFTKTVLFMHGVILMRDASQQANTGIEICEPIKSYCNMQPGDLLFFGKMGEKNKKVRIRHVGIYIGNNEYIHASGCVRVSSFDSKKPNYDEANVTELVKTVRIVGEVDTDGIWSIDKNPLYNVQE